MPIKLNSVHGTYEGIGGRQLWLVVHYGTGHHVQHGPATLLSNGKWDHSSMDIFPEIEKGTFILYAVLCDEQTCETLRESLNDPAGLPEWPPTGVEIVNKQDLVR